MLDNVQLPTYYKLMSKYYLCKHNKRHIRNPSPEYYFITSAVVDNFLGGVGKFEASLDGDTIVAFGTLVELLAIKRLLGANHE